MPWYSDRINFANDYRNSRSRTRDTAAFDHAFSRWKTGKGCDFDGAVLGNVDDQHHKITFNRKRKRQLCNNNAPTAKDLAVAPLLHTPLLHTFNPLLKSKINAGLRHSYLFFPQFTSPKNRISHTFLERTNINKNRDLATSF